MSVKPQVELKPLQGEDLLQMATRRETVVARRRCCAHQNQRYECSCVYGGLDILLLMTEEEDRAGWAVVVRVWALMSRRVHSRVGVRLEASLVGMAVSMAVEVCYACPKRDVAMVRCWFDHERRSWLLPLLSRTRSFRCLRAFAALRSSRQGGTALEGVGDDGDGAGAGAGDVLMDGW